MNLSVMSFNRIRDLVLNLGVKDGSSGDYVPRKDCLVALEKLEDELVNEDEANCNVRFTLHICGTVQNDLLPILTSNVDSKLFVVALRILVTLSMPVEYGALHDKTSFTARTQTVNKHLLACSLALKKAFLHFPATLALVTCLRETIIKLEKQLVPLTQEENNNLKNCLFLLRNVLHLPDVNKILGENARSTVQNWQSVQNKLIWNLFVQGVDGALLLMLNSKCRKQWTVPLALILGSLYEKQNLDNISHNLELVSSESEDSENERESDDSKNSDTSLSSDPSKNMDVGNDSALTDEADSQITIEIGNFEKSNQGETSNYAHKGREIHTNLEKVQIGEDSGKTSQSEKDQKLKVAISVGGVDYGNSSPCVSPYHKRMKGNPPDDKKISHPHLLVKKDSGISECSIPSDVMENKSSDDDVFEAKTTKQTKSTLHQRKVQSHCQMSETDSSNDDIHTKKIHRNHPPNIKRKKSDRNSNGCSPSICLESALKVLHSNGRVRYPLWEKRNSATLVGLSSRTPSYEDIGILLKEFTLSFLHCGFSKLVLDLKELFLKGQHLVIDKSVLFWVVGYFLPLARKANICLDHIREIISNGTIGILVFECVNLCEKVEINSNSNRDFVRYLTVQMKLLTMALKEVLLTIDTYSQKCNSPKDRAAFNELNGKLAGLKDLRNLPLLLFQIYPLIKKIDILEDVALINHHILILIGRGAGHCMERNKINFIWHLRSFATKEIVHCYGKLLKRFRSNSEHLNGCIFTMLHHLTGDSRSLELLFVPQILMNFSDMLQEEYELEQYQEDLIMYVLNKFSVKICRESANKEDKALGNGSVVSAGRSCASSVDVPTEPDDLYWWYLQFELDEDPIARIAEHISMSKQDILFQLKLKGVISHEKYQKFTGIKDGVETDCAKTEEVEEIPNFDEDITKLLLSLVHDGHRHQILWLQEVLLETCYIKNDLKRNVEEPVPFYSIQMMVSVPLVPYCEKQRKILKDKSFLTLLEKLGFHLGCEETQLYPRIPLYWTADMLFKIACRVGPIKKDVLKLTYPDLDMWKTNEEEVHSSDEYPPLPLYSSYHTLSSWLYAVQQARHDVKDRTTDAYIRS